MNLILYDGVCGFCNKSVQVVLDHDKDGKFHFASLQSDLAHSILLRHKKDPSELSTIYLVENFEPAVLKQEEKLYTRSEAALRIAGELSFPWRLLKIFLLVPTALRDWGYQLIANNRYKIAGKLESCRLPSSEERARFLDI